jgi:excisionase family DNA binding protein
MSESKAGPQIRGKLLTVAEAAKKIHKDGQWIYTRIRKGTLPFPYVKDDFSGTGKYLIDSADIEDWQQRPLEKIPAGMKGGSPSGRSWLNAREAAEYAGIGHTTLYDWIREKKLPFRSYPLAPRIRKFDPADIDAWRKSQGREAGTGPVFPRKRKNKKKREVPMKH